MLVVVITMFLFAKAPSTLCITILKLAYFFPSFAPFVSYFIGAYVMAIGNIIVIAVHPITFAVYMLMSR
jgi:hypothetical protein